MKRKHIVHLVVIAVLLLSGVMITGKNSAYACSCAEPGSYEESLEKSDLVFDGVVTKKNEKNSLFGIRSSVDPIEWTFQVNGSWKGEVTELMTVASAASSDSCGYEFEVGKRYAVFAYKSDEGFVSSLCSKTLIIADNSDIFTELGPYTSEVNIPPTVDQIDGIMMEPSSPDAVMKIATEEEVKQSIQDRKMMLMIAFVIVGLLFIVGAFVLIRRIRSK